MRKCDVIDDGVGYRFYCGADGTAQAAIRAGGNAAARGGIPAEVAGLERAQERLATHRGDGRHDAGWTPSTRGLK